MVSRLLSTLVALGLVAFVAGCSDAPTAKYESSKSTLEGARAAEAEQYAPELFKAAADSLSAAAVEIEKENGRFSMLRDYDRAEEIIASAQNLAAEAQAAAAAEKEKVRLEDSALLVEIDSLIAQTKASLAKAPKGKGSRIDLKVMQADLDGAGSALVAATTEFQGGQYLTAREKLQAIKSQVMRVKGDIDAASAGVSKK